MASSRLATGFKKNWPVIVLSTLCILLLVALVVAIVREAPGDKKPSYLYSQTAQSADVARQGDTVTVTLHDVSPSTVRFSEYPDRIAGTEDTGSFIGNWQTLFRRNEPNASFSYLGEGGARGGTAVGRIAGASYDGGSVVYSVKVFPEGEKANVDWKGDPVSAMPQKTGAVAIFIDASAADDGDNTGTDTGDAEPQPTGYPTMPLGTEGNPGAPSSRYVWRTWQVDQNASGGADPLPVELGTGRYDHINSASWRILYCGEDESGGYLLAYDDTSSFGMYRYDFSARGSTDPLTEPPLSNGKWQFSSTACQLVYLDGDLVLELEQQPPWSSRVWRFNRAARGGENPLQAQACDAPKPQTWYSEGYYLGNDYYLYVPTLAPSDRWHKRDGWLMKINRGDTPSVTARYHGVCPVVGYFSELVYLDNGMLLQVGDYWDKAHTDDFLLIKLNYDATNLTDLLGNVTDRGRWHTINSNQRLAYVGRNIMFNLGDNSD